MNAVCTSTISLYSGLRGGRSYVSIIYHTEAEFNLIRRFYYEDVQHQGFVAE